MDPSHQTQLPAFEQGGSLSIGIQLYQHLRESIIRGELRPGQALSESEIGKRYAVSRQPVREAFIKLAEERLVSVLPQRGTFVMKISLADVLDARFVREVIEVALVQEAALHAMPEKIKALREILAAQARLSPGHNVEFMDLDEAFHRELAYIVHHEHAWRVIEGIKAQMDRVRYLSLDDSTPIALIIEQHTRIVDSIEAGDATAAAAAMRSHLREIMASLPLIAEKNPEVFES